MIDDVDPEARRRYALGIAKHVRADLAREKAISGVEPTVILVANSIPYSRGRLQRSKSGAAGPGQRRPRPPLAEPLHVDRRRRQEVLKVGLCLTNIATLSQPAPRTATGTPRLSARGGPPAAPRAVHGATAQ
jgi:hypothetical protein